MVISGGREITEDAIALVHLRTFKLIDHGKQNK